MYKREFVQLCNVLPPMQGETFQIKHYEVPPLTELGKMRLMFEGNLHITQEHLIKQDYTYTMLRDKGGIWMSDTPMEVNSNREFLRNANGDVLVFGLGIGLIIFPLLDCPDIKSITIVEREQEIIDMVGKHLKSDKVKIILGDADEIEFPKEQKFDTIYFDIWKTISSENYEHTKELHKRFRKNFNYKNPKRFMDSWLRDHIRSEHYKEQKEGIYGWH